MNGISILWLSTNSSGQLVEHPESFDAEALQSDVAGVLLRFEHLRQCPTPGRVMRTDFIAINQVELVELQSFAPSCRTWPVLLDLNIYANQLHAELTAAQARGRLRPRSRGLELNWTELLPLKQTHKERSMPLRNPKVASLIGELKGAPASIILTMLLLGRPLRRKDLITYTRYSGPTIDKALDRLELLDLVQQPPGQSPLHAHRGRQAIYLGRISRRPTGG